MNQTLTPTTPASNDYAKISEVATALHRHERTVRGYILLLHEEYGHPDFLEKLNGRRLSPRQQKVLTKLAQYKKQRTPNTQIRDFLMADCSVRLTLTEACDWLSPHIPKALLTQFQEHFRP